jgi:hypothetical protein
VLPSALLLALRQPIKPEKPELPPLLCHHLEAWGLPCRRLNVGDDLVALERGLLLHLLVEAGLAGFLWGGLRLAVVRLVVPGSFLLPAGHSFANAAEDLDFLEAVEPRPARGAWEDARVYWYDLAAEDEYAGR